MAIEYPKTVETKNPLKSKTLWANGIMALAALLNKIFGGPEIGAEETAGVIAVVNIILRLVTKGKITLS
jgi:hypothetical protein